MKYLFIALCAIIVTGLASSCYADNKEELYKDFNPTVDTTGCDTAMITYTQVRPIVLANCGTSGCHAGSSPSSGLDLTTYESTEQIATDGRLMNRITGNPGPLMPPSGKLPQNEIDILLAWAKNPCPQ